MSNAKASIGSRLDQSLDRWLDFFIPQKMQNDPAAHRRARMFMLSHMFGPILGGSIPLYIWITNIEIDYRFWTFLGSILAFWVYPFVLRKTKQYELCAFVSVQNLAFCIFWACYSYGGIFSPFLCWAIIIPLLAFLYLPAEGITRNILLTQIIGSGAVFSALVVAGYPFPATDLQQFQVIGMVSLVAAAIYLAMMSLYFAKMFRDQQDFERELGKLVQASGDIANLTDAANEARTAKAEFVASMSHEMRTPLNAIIGYSQLLLEDAECDGDDDVKDIQNIHSAGTALLDLIDDILDISKIDAGKMVEFPQAGNIADWWCSTEPQLTAENCAKHISFTAIGETSSYVVDWSLLTKAIKHLVDGLTEEGVEEFRVVHAGQDATGARIRIFGAEQICARPDAARMFELFSDVADASPTKYGRASVKLALARKFAQLADGQVEIVRVNGKQCIEIWLPDRSETDVAEAA